MYVNVNASIIIDPPLNLIIPTLAYSSNSITLVWNKPTIYSNVAGYNIYENNKLIGTTTNLNYTSTNLSPNTSYTFTVRSKNSSNIESSDSNSVNQKTLSTQQIFDITNYGAIGDGKTLNTTNIQATINACTPGGIVLIPSGTFLSGAINLKSNISLEINGTLLGSDNPSDYSFTSKRFPYYATNNYMGLINAYTTDYGTISNVKVFGNGIVNGGSYSSGSSLTTLGSAETTLQSDSARGDLITVKGVTNFYLGGITLINPAEHTIFISYSKNITVDGISAKTFGIHNADGIDLATSNNAQIFNSYFDNGDDCINLNAGYGADGVKEAMPCSNVRIFNDTTNRGHGGVVFGSFTAGWIEDILVEDCTFNGTNIGLRFKTNKTMGGGATDVTARDITMTNIVNDAIFFDSNYSGTPTTNPASEGVFHHITVQNISCKNTGGYGIWINALPSAYNSNINLTNVTLTDYKKGASISYLQNSTFNNVNFIGTNSSPWSTSNVSNVNFINCTPQP